MGAGVDDDGEPRVKDDDGVGGHGRDVQRQLHGLLRIKREAEDARPHHERARREALPARRPPATRPRALTWSWCGMRSCSAMECGELLIRKRERFWDHHWATTMCVVVCAGAPVYNRPSCRDLLTTMRGTHGSGCLVRAR